MKLRYYSAACELLGVVPSIDPKALKLIEAAEKKAKWKLPAAIRELYLVAELRELLLTTNKIESHISALNDLLKNFGFSADNATEFHASSELIIADREDDDIRWVGIRLYRTANPTVQLLNVYGDEMKVGCKYSEHLLDLIWYAHALRHHGTATVERVEVGPPHIDYLSEGFVLYPAPIELGYLDIDSEIEGQILRWHRPGQVVELETLGDPRTEFTTGIWRIHARTQNDLFAFYDSFRPIQGHSVRVYRPGKIVNKVFTQAFQSRFPTVKIEH